MAKSATPTEDKNENLETFYFPHGIDGNSEVAVSLEGTSPEDAIERHQKAEKTAKHDDTENVNAAGTDTAEQDKE